MIDKSNSVGYMIEIGDRKVFEKYFYSWVLLVFMLYLVCIRLGDGMEEKSQQKGDSGNIQDFFVFKVIVVGCEFKSFLVFRMIDKDCFEKEIINLFFRQSNVLGKFGVI